MTSPLKLTLQFLEPLTIDQKIFLIDILKTLKGQGSFCLFILLTIPFCTPIQIPGVSTPFGFIMAFLALRKLLGHKILLPKFFQNHSIKGPHLKKIIQAGYKLEKVISKISKQRALFFCQNYFFKILQLIVILISALILGLPLPIPLTNIAFAWIILLISLGHLMNDGLFILAGYILFLSIAFFLIAIIF